jgi:DNA-binding winged helix-turn-helix (wHTH) protein
MTRWLFADFVLDPRARVLRRGGATLHLEPKVMDLLIYVLEQRDRCVYKDELYRELWGDVKVGPSSLARLIMELRRAVGDDGVQQRYLRTVNGRGYQFVAEVVCSAETPAISGIAPALRGGAMSMMAAAAATAGAAAAAAGPHDDPTLQGSEHGQPRVALSLWRLHPPPLLAVPLAGRDRVRIGRGAECELSLDGERISRLHAEVTRVGPAYFVRDLASRNGTFVDGSPVAHAALRAGQLLRFGDVLVAVNDSATGPAVASVLDRFRDALRQQTGGKPPALSARLLEALCLHRWHAGGRDLSALVRQMLLAHGHEPRLSFAHLPESIQRASLAGAGHSDPPIRPSAREPGAVAAQPTRRRRRGGGGDELR